MPIFYLYSQSVPLKTKGAFIPVWLGDVVQKQGGVSHLANFFLDICEQNSWTEIDPEEVVSARFYWNPGAARTRPTQQLEQIGVFMCSLSTGAQMKKKIVCLGAALVSSAFIALLFYLFTPDLINFGVQHLRNVLICQHVDEALHLLAAPVS